MSFVVLFLIGLFIGSFLNVVIDRIPRGETIFVGRSHCEYCKHALSWYDLFPLFSFLVLRGRCRYCHTFIGWKYPLIEITTGLCFAFLSFLLPLSTSVLFLVTLGIFSCLVVIFYTDIFSGIIPDSVLVILGIFSFMRLLLTHQMLLPTLLSGIAACLLFLFLFLITKGRGMGLGDVKYVLVMGVLLSFPMIIVGLYIAFLTGAALALILVMVKKKTFASTIPFGPFLVLGTVLAFLWGPALWTTCLRLLNV